MSFHPDLVDNCGFGRRIVKAVDNSADWDATYHYYWDGWRMIEMRNGSDQVLKQHVWGRQYVDELVQIAVNHDPSNADSGTTENECERFFYVCQDANYNVLGVTMSTGRLIERYEYTPYGQRTVFSHGWLRADLDGDGFVGQADLDIILDKWGDPEPASPADLDGTGMIGMGDLDVILDSLGDGLAGDDPLVSAAVLETSRGTDDAFVALCEFGHQGLPHDKEVYGQRWQVETVFSMIKRRLGSAVNARSYWSQCRTLMLKAVTHNTLILYAHTQQQSAAA